MKKIKITQCQECPYCRYLTENEKHECTYRGLEQIISNIERIPDWCPLEDIEQEDSKPMNIDQKNYLRTAKQCIDQIVETHYFGSSQYPPKEQDTRKNAGTAYNAICRIEAIENEEKPMNDQIIDPNQKSIADSLEEISIKLGMWLDCQTSINNSLSEIAFQSSQSFHQRINQLEQKLDGLIELSERDLARINELERRLKVTDDEQASEAELTNLTPDNQPQPQELIENIIRHCEILRDRQLSENDYYGRIKNIIEIANELNTQL